MVIILEQLFPNRTTQEKKDEKEDIEESCSKKPNDILFTNMNSDKELTIQQESDFTKIQSVDLTSFTKEIASKYSTSVPDSEEIKDSSF